MDSLVSCYGGQTSGMSVPRVLGGAASQLSARCPLLHLMQVNLSGWQRKGSLTAVAAPAHCVPTVLRSPKPSGLRCPRWNAGRHTLWPLQGLKGTPEPTLGPAPSSLAATVRASWLYLWLEGGRASAQCVGDASGCLLWLESFACPPTSLRRPHAPHAPGHPVCLLPPSMQCSYTVACSGHTRWSRHPLVHFSHLRPPPLSCLGRPRSPSLRAATRCGRSRAAARGGSPGCRW